MLRREEVERIKEQYPKGTPVRLYSMEGEQTVPPGSRGVVDHVDDIGQIHMKWEKDVYKRQIMPRKSAVGNQSLPRAVPLISM